jgi:hypothetical protein
MNAKLELLNSRQLSISWLYRLQPVNRKRSKIVLDLHIW